MVTKVDQNVFDKVLAFAPPRPAFHLFVSRNKRKKDRYVLMWKEWRFYGESPEEIISKLKVFKEYNYHLL